MALRVCSQAGCPELVTQGKCETHRREHEQRRGTRQERGYDASYDRARKRVAPRVATGMVICWACLKRITALEPWHLGHCENDRNIIHGPEHPDCNLKHIGKPCPHVSHA